MQTHSYLFNFSVYNQKQGFAGKGEDHFFSFCMSEESLQSPFGSYIHSSFPKGLRCNPYQSEVTPNSQLQNSSFSFQEFRRNSELLNASVSEGNGTVDENASIEDNHEDNEVYEAQGHSPIEDIIEVDDLVDERHEIQVNTPVHNALNSFGNFIFDIYQSSAYYMPTNHSPLRNRFQYMNEYYRRMVQLIQSSTKQEAASEDTIKKLCVVPSI